MRRRSRGNDFGQVLRLFAALIVEGQRVQEIGRRCIGPLVVRSLSLCLVDGASPSLIILAPRSGRRVLAVAIPRRVRPRPFNGPLGCLESCSWNGRATRCVMEEMRRPERIDVPAGHAMICH